MQQARCLTPLRGSGWLPSGGAPQHASCSTRVVAAGPRPCRVDTRRRHSVFATSGAAAAGVPASSPRKLPVRPLLAATAAAAPGSNGNGTTSTAGDASEGGPHLQASDRVLKLWREANAVCFDVDCEWQRGWWCSSRLDERAGWVGGCLHHSRLQASPRVCAARSPVKASAANPQPLHPHHARTHARTHAHTHTHTPPTHAGTITVNDSLDLLAEFMGVGESVAAVTNKVRALEWGQPQQQHASGRLAFSLFRH
jgi:hypothetical protein